MLGPNFVGLAINHLINYRLGTIISRGLYFFTPFFTAVYNQERLILETIHVVNKEILPKIFILKSISKSKGGYNGTCMVIN